MRKDSSAFKLSSLTQMQNPGCMVMVDNCYGEFVDDIEPPMVVCEVIFVIKVLHVEIADVDFWMSRVLT